MASATPTPAEPAPLGCDRARWQEITDAIGGYDIEAKAHAIAAALRACDRLPPEIGIYADQLAAAKRAGEFVTAYVEYDEKVWQRWYGRSFQDCLPEQCHARYVRDGYIDDEPYTDEKFLSFFAYAIIAWLIERGLEPDEIRPVANALFEVEAVALLAAPPPPPPPE